MKEKITSEGTIPATVSRVRANGHLQSHRPFSFPPQIKTSNPTKAYKIRWIGTE